ncbi:MAG: GYD domain-containing protein [Anaerolineales bacterium]
MAKYLVQFSYTGEGLQGLLKEGGSKRREATRQLIESLGGKMESYYFSFGDYDGFVIVDGFDNISVTAAAMISSASGAVKTKTTVLLTCEEVDQATKKQGDYRPPGK